MTLRPHTLAEWPGEPYPAAFRVSGDDGNRTHLSLLARRTRLPLEHAPPSEVRPGIGPGLPPYHGGVLP